ncbi:hypothetical protein VNO77_39301 [Canavalia gladiata]|uniref:P-type ATPase A domain-containing protein n=1 Tax=Canavalia gladiata TaxID=3824 RepID=A0AAN9PX07_CANGL
MVRFASKAKVLWNSRWNEQDATVLIPGDIIGIKLGDFIPIDARLLKIDQFALTAELSSRESKIIVYAVELLCLLSNESDESKWEITAACGMPPLVQILEIGSENANHQRLGEDLNSSNCRIGTLRSCGHKWLRSHCLKVHKMVFSSDTGITYVGSLKLEVDTRELEGVSHRLVDDFSCIMVIALIARFARLMFLPTKYFANKVMESRVKRSASVPNIDLGDSESHVSWWLVVDDGFAKE